MAIETPTQVLQRLREQARQERVAQASNISQRFMSATDPAQKATAFGEQLGNALFKRFGKEAQPEDSPEVAQAKARQQWLSVDPSDVESIKGNIKAAADSGDYEVANYLTNLYFKAADLQLNKDSLLTKEQVAKMKADAEGVYKPQSTPGKTLADADALEAAGKTKEAALLREKLKEEQARNEATAQKEYSDQVDKTFGNTFGLDVKTDLSSSDYGPMFQSISESAVDRSRLGGQKLGDIRNEITKYVENKTGPLTDDRLDWTDRARKDFKEGKIGFGIDKNDRSGLYHMNDKGEFTGFIMYVPNSDYLESIK